MKTTSPKKERLDLIVERIDLAGRHWREGRELRSDKLSRLQQIDKQLEAPPWTEKEALLFRKVCQNHGVLTKEIPMKWENLKHLEEKVFIHACNALMTEDAFEFFGINTLSVAELIDELRAGCLEIAKYQDSKDCIKSHALEAFHSIGTKYGPIACALFERLFKEGKEPPLPAYVVANRVLSSDSTPKRILFWANIDAIQMLYEAIEGQIKATA